MNKLAILLSVLIIITQFYSCQKEDRGIVKEKITGQVQKGPYVNGTNIIMHELNSSLQQTGSVFSSQITSNTGLFEILNVNLSSSYVELSANGFYFDENKGDISIAQLNLNALADLSDISTVNVNILTHLEKRRVEYLVQSGNSFTEAKRKAQKEVLAIFGLNKENMTSSESLDISVNNENNAILLAISIILQGKRSVGDLTELLANLTNDLYQDGVVNDPEIITNLRNHTLALSLPEIRTSLEDRYDELGISTTIPDFEKYVNEFISFSTQMPKGVTLDATNVASTTTTLGGYINPGSLMTEVTFEYGTTTDYGNSVPGDPSQIDGAYGVKITANIESLNPATEYHYRIVAENSLGRFNGPDKVFKTKGLVIDIEGNHYQTLVIGTQEWMIENLKTTKYNDGEAISDLPSLLASSLEINFYDTPYYCWYNNDEDLYKEIYGALYNCAAVNTGKLCPTVWHVPTDTEWTTLTTFLGGEELAGSKLKETGNEHWNNPNYANNESGFKALPGGESLPYPVFQGVKGIGYFWTSTIGEPEGDGSGIASNAYIRYLVNYQTACYRNLNGRDNGASVRCIKD